MLTSTKLENVCESVQYGYTASANTEKVGPKFLRITDIVKDFISWSEVPYCKISESNHKKYKLYKGDIVVARTGNTTGHAKLIKEEVDAVFASYLIRFKINPSLADSEYVGRIIESNLFRKYVWSIIGGSAQPGINATHLKKFSFVLPSEKHQRKVATILRSYEDLIKNNLKRIKLLEEKAQLTYEEWFVRMKYPGHENDVVDSETGLPEGWVKGVLSDIIGFQNGFAYKSSRFEKCGFPVVKIKNIEDNSISTSNVDFINSSYADETKKFKLSSGDLLIAMTGATVGKVGVVPILKTPAYLNQRVGRFLVKEKNNNIFFVKSFFTVGDGLKYVTNIARGAAQPNISSSQVLSIPLNIPSLELLKKYSTMSEIIYKNILFLRSQNQNLKMARSILLPRLMSGMIEIDEIKYNYPKETLA